MKIETHTGRATMEMVRKGTGSEHEAIVLRTDTGDTLTLVRIGGNPFNDPDTIRLKGKTVEARGYRIGNELRYLSAVTVQKAKK